MAGPLIGGLIGMIGVGGGGYLFGATLWASVLAGASLGSLFESQQIDLGGNSPNYSFGELSNTKTQLLPIPVVYGRCRIAGNVFYRAYLDDNKQKMHQYIGISEGPVHAISEIRVNDLDPNDGTLAGCSATAYLNTGPDTSAPEDPDGARPYPDDFAWIRTTLQVQEKLNGNPVVTSIVEGREVWTPSGTAYSRNPAWIVLDLLTNARYGFGIPLRRIDPISFEAAAAYCDGDVGGAPRFTLDYTLDVQKPGIDHLGAMLACFRGYLVCRDKVELRIDAPATSYDKEVGPDNIVAGSFSWWQSSDEDRLNRCIIEWVDPENSWERTVTVFEDTADIERRGVVEGTYSLLGITRPEQAARMGAYLLDASAGVRHFCTFNVSLMDADIEAGDVLALTHDLPGWEGKWMRVVAVTDNDSVDDEITIVCSEYVEEIYNDRAMDVPLHVDTNLPNPYACPDPAALSATERISVQPDGTILSDIDVFWTDPPVLLRHVEVLLLEQDGTQWRSCGVVAPGVGSFVVRGVRSDQSVIVMARAVNSLGIKSAGASRGLVLYGKATPPGEPSNLTAVGGFQTVSVEWTNPGDADLRHVEIRESQTSDFAEAYPVGEISGTRLVRTNLGTVRAYWYWARAVDTSGNVSGWTGPASATTQGIVPEDFPEPIIEESMLAPILAEKVADIPSLRGEVDDLADAKIPEIRADVDHLADVRIPAVELDVSDLLENIVPNLSADMEEIRDDILDVRIPGALSRLKGYVDERHRAALDGVNKASESAVDALLDLEDVGDVLRDAGVYVDPASGEVRIWGVEQLRTETGVRLTTAEQLISAQDAKISQKVTLAQVDERIAGAVFGDAGELLLSGVDQRISEVEQTLEAQEAAITARATVTEVTAQGGRITTAEQKISGMEGTISTLATHAEVTELGSRVTTAESSIDAINGRITDEVVAIGQSSRNINDLLAQTVIDEILTNDEARKDLNLQIAVARTDLSAKIEEGVAAEAAQRTLLAAMVADHYSFFANETKVIADQTKSLAETMTRWEADFESAATAVVQNVVKVYADEVEALATTVTEMGAEFGPAIAVLSETASAHADEIDAVAESVTNLGVEFGKAVAGVLEKVSANAADAKAAVQKNSDMVAAITKPLAEGAVERILDAEEDRKYATEQFALIRTDYATRIEEGLFSEATKREQLGAVLDDEIYNRQAAIETEQKARTDADGAIVENVTNLQTRMKSAEDGLETKADIEMVQNVFSGENEAWAQTRNTLIAEVDQKDTNIDTALKGIIQSIDRARATDTEAIVERLNRQVAAVTRPVAETAVDAILDAEEQAKREAVQYAAIFTEATTRVEEGLFSEAAKREQLESKLDDSLSLIRTEQRTYTDNKVGAETELRTNLEARYGETAAKVQEHSQAIVGLDGDLKAMWTLKVDAGKVAGIGLYADDEVSEFTIHADKFFMYSDGNGPSEALESKQVFSVANNQLVFNGDIFARPTEGGDGIVVGGKIRGDKIYADSRIQLGPGGHLLIDDGGLIQVGRGQAGSPKIIYMDQNGARFRVDHFAVVQDMDGVAAYPFEVVGGVVKVKKAVMQKLELDEGEVKRIHIEDAAIDAAKIEELTVDTLHIHPGAISNTYLAYNAGFELTASAKTGAYVDVVVPDIGEGSQCYVVAMAMGNASAASVYAVGNPPAKGRFLMTPPSGVSEATAYQEIAQLGEDFLAYNKPTQFCVADKMLLPVGTTRISFQSKVDQISSGGYRPPRLYGHKLIVMALKR